MASSGRCTSGWPAATPLTAIPKQALEHARKALVQAPDALNRQSLEAMVAALEAGRPIAQ